MFTALGARLGARARALAGGDGLVPRALRGSAVTMLGFGASVLLRLAGNLILTRLLFPEAFGLMALVTVLMVGIAMLSDVGLGLSIQQSPRGDDPVFLGTCWSVQLLRTVILFILACALAAPAAAFYGAPDLALLLPAAALAILIEGFTPIRKEAAIRHLRLGRLTVLDTIAQASGLVVMVVLAFALRSVWALVLGSIAGAVVRLALIVLFLPGPRIAPAWDRSALGDILRFGVWVFFSSLCGFLIQQGDKAILGVYLTLDQLGIYNIGYFLASFPILLGHALAGRVLIPVYREAAAAADAAATRRRMRRMRAGLTALLLAPLLAMAFAATPLIGVLYDPRYADAAGVLAAMAAPLSIQIVGITYDQAALAAGNSRGFFVVVAARSAIQTAAFLIGLNMGGFPAALVAYGIGVAIQHLFVIRLAVHHGVWDPVHDAVALGIALPLVGLALWLNAPALAALAAFG
jgi:O-antigen/teichoic acid export membrane protein